MSAPDALVLSQPLSLKQTNSTTVFSWSDELKHLFSSRFFNILWWPVFKMQQRYITTSPLLRACNKLPGFSNLWKTIQKGSFAYNILFLHSNPAHKSSRATHLADITTLALFFGDEFLDGICLAAGKPYIKTLFSGEGNNFYMQVKQTDDTVEVEYAFDLKEKLPATIMERRNEKYLISYYRFYELLKLFLVMINKQLKLLSNSKAEITAKKIADVCNNCFDSYLSDVINCPIQDNCSDVLRIKNLHELKTREMQKKLLELRCILAGKEQLTDRNEIEGWLDIMSVVQVYDDLQDVALDDEVQDNFVLFMAKKYFPVEWKWFLQNKDIIKKAKQKHGMLLSLNMPCSVQASLQFAVDKIKNMNWEQQKIIHYLLAKNWFLNAPIFSRNDVDDQLNLIYNLVKQRMDNTPDYVVKSYAIETCFHDKKASKELLKKVNYKTAYQLRYNLLAIPAHIKAGIFDAVAQG